MSYSNGWLELTDKVFRYTACDKYWIGEKYFLYLYVTEYRWLLSKHINLGNIKFYTGLLSFREVIKTIISEYIEKHGLDSLYLFMNSYPSIKLELDILITIINEGEEL